MWKAYRSRRGRPQFKLDGKAVLAYRLAYDLLIGPIPEGLVPDHLCRNTVCIRPSHLEPVTQMVNVHRGKSMEQKPCRFGHPRELGRRCRECNKIYQREWMRNHRNTAKLRREAGLNEKE